MGDGNVNVARMSHYSFICFYNTGCTTAKFSNSSDRVRFFSNLCGLCFRTRFMRVCSHLRLTAGPLSLHRQLGAAGYPWTPHGHGPKDRDMDRQGHPVKMDSCVRLGALPWNRRKTCLARDVKV
jgi:hypothetical protein